MTVGMSDDEPLGEGVGGRVPGEDGLVQRDRDGHRGWGLGAQMRGLMRCHIDLPGLRWHRITAEPSGDPGLAPFRSCHDLFGDRSLVLLPTPGHTPGSVSLLSRRPDRPPLIMVGDLTYDAHLLESGHVPGVGSRPRLRETTAMVNTMRHQHPGLVVLPAHDPAAASRLAQATGQARALATA
jgi:N-acyl homoserine lactone hydrolase